MGFRSGAYATVWEINQEEKKTTLKISISRKDRDTGTYVTDFSKFITLFGDAHKAAGNLSKGDKIKLGDCDVSTYYDKEKRKEYITFKVFRFETAGDTNRQNSPEPTNTEEGNPEPGEGKKPPF